MHVTLGVWTIRPVPCASALGKEHDLCQEFRRLIGESLGFKGGSMGAEDILSESLGNAKSR